MKNYVLLSLLLIAAKCAVAQNTNLTYKFALKLYNATSYEKRGILTRADDRGRITQTTVYTLDFFKPTLAFQWQARNGNTHEIELTDLSLKRKDNLTTFIQTYPNIYQYPSEGNDLTTTAIAARYEYIFNFNKKKDTHWVPSLGTAVSAYFRREDFTPKTSLDFPNIYSRVGVRTFVIPRLTYFLNSKWFLDVNIPICFSDAYYQSEKVSDPAIFSKDRRIDIRVFDLFAQLYSGRIGVGLKL